MLEYTGKYGTAKVMIDFIDKATVSQIYEFLNHKAFTNPIVVMPDCHYGKGAVIGFTMPMTNMIIPNIVGTDINCALFFINIGKTILNEMSRIDIDKMIRNLIPFGNKVHKESPVIDKGFFKSVSDEHRKFVMKFNKRFDTHYDPIDYDISYLEQKCNEIGMSFDRTIKSIGTLGSGNHFIEMGKSLLTDDYCFTVHSGSRQFGYKVCQYWQKKAGKGVLAYLTGDDMFGYLSDTVLAQKYADLNRLHMINYVLEACNYTWTNVKQSIQTSHNFIDFDDFIIRKGAIRSYIDEYMIIPFNMEDGILICSGRSNPEWNYSAPHGAGRVGSRRWAKENLDLETTKERMEKNNIYFSKLPIDELKEAYKDPKIIENAIKPTAMIVDRIKPILVMKD